METINLLETREIYRKEFKKFVEKHKLIVNKENKDLNLKSGDIITFYAGYHGDINYKSEILGFDEENKAYVLWDCYWVAIDLVERKYQLVK